MNTTHERQNWMGLMARANPTRLSDLFADLPAHHYLRQPEVGAVMVRGRTGGVGQPFNLGEMTVTRCTVQLDNGLVGHAHIQGRNKDHATRAAILDALLQGAEAAAITAQVLMPLTQDEDAKRQARADKAAATKVEFFTLVRGEDQ
jgi:alpha-D-ribose 1-methylphosphonate 5-triphosphate synthase subunit PhnG